MKTFRFLFAILIFLPAIYGQANDAINRAVKSYDDNWNKKNVDGVSNILADEYVYFSSTGGLTDRKKTLEFLASPDYKLTFVERSEVTVLAADDRVAVVSSRWKGRGTYGKEVINDDQRCGLVFVSRSGLWKLLSEHCAQIVSK
ncbi:MAG TPA: nuclear transport factor 2 family protein [Pyrinomonadaceae bacterium]|nr:nuclear transport factor 2 family protein [Pyrinomonadaceae bacterium]